MRWVCRYCNSSWEASNSSQCPCCRSFLIEREDQPPADIIGRLSQQLTVLNRISETIRERTNRPQSPTLANAARDVLHMATHLPQTLFPNSRVTFVFDPSAMMNPGGVIRGADDPESRPLTPSKFNHRNVDPGEVKEGAVCSICYEEFKKGERVCELPCKHLFHDACIRQWFHEKGNCPICRKQLAPEKKARSPSAIPGATFFIFMF